jgi:UDP-N-acetylglucosamine 2-epimerase (non-hydrolysing)
MQKCKSLVVELPYFEHCKLDLRTQDMGRIGRFLHPTSRAVSGSLQMNAIAGKKVLTIFGTRPEAIKLAPVIQELETRAPRLQVINTVSGQHTELLHPFVKLFGLQIHHDLAVMQPNQTPAQVCSRVLALVDPVLEREQPDLVLVQGDTTTTLAGALAGFYRRIPVGHVEAGLRSGDLSSPFPEEMNRRLVTRLATYHFAATERNRNTLLAEGVPSSHIFVTGNPVVQALHTLLPRCSPSAATRALLEATAKLRTIILTTHRRESFGEVLAANLHVIRSFVERHSDIAVIFPVHPNPHVTRPALQILGGQPRVHLTQPLGYEDFIVLLSRCWLIVSDSGGVQEEAPTLGKPVLVIRENTERPEAISAGVARLVGGSPDALARMLEEIYREGTWRGEVQRIENPFGGPDSGKRIAEAIGQILFGEKHHEHTQASDSQPATAR